MIDERPAELLHAIENLINAKLFDAISRPDGLARLVGQRASGVASHAIRLAERELETALSHSLSASVAGGRRL